VVVPVSASDSQSVLVTDRKLLIVICAYGGGVEFRQFVSSNQRQRSDGGVACSAAADRGACCTQFHTR